MISFQAHNYGVKASVKFMNILVSLDLNIVLAIPVTLLNIMCLYYNCAVLCNNVCVIPMLNFYVYREW